MGRLCMSQDFTWHSQDEIRHHVSRSGKAYRKAESEHGQDNRKQEGQGDICADDFVFAYLRENYFDSHMDRVKG